MGQFVWGNAIIVLMGKKCDEQLIDRRWSEVKVFLVMLLGQFFLIH